MGLIKLKKVEGMSLDSTMDTRMFVDYFLGGEKGLFALKTRIMNHLQGVIRSFKIESIA